MSGYDLFVMYVLLFLFIKGVLLNMEMELFDWIIVFYFLCGVVFECVDEISGLWS